MRTIAASSARGWHGRCPRPARGWHANRTGRPGQQRDSSQERCSSQDTSCPSPPVAQRPGNGSREELPSISRPGFMPPRGTDEGSGLTPHRQESAKADQGLILPACAKMLGQQVRAQAPGCSPEPQFMASDVSEAFRTVSVPVCW